MIGVKKRYINDEKGNRTGVLLNIDDYNKILEELEELYSIRVYDAAKGSGDEVIPFEEAVTEYVVTFNLRPSPIWLCKALNLQT